MSEPLRTPSVSRRTTRPRWRRALSIVGIVLGILVALAGGGGLYLWIQLTASLPQLDGKAAIAGLSAPVDIARDNLGVPLLRASNRLDAARALGFLHGQERMFQMDLLRRDAAGELAELIGPKVIANDKKRRLHRFRHRAHEIVGQLGDDEKALLEAYAAGVNAGVAALGAKPPEYLALRSRPEPWLPEDSLLAVYAMFLDLQDEEGKRDSDLGLLRDLIPAEMVAFMNPIGTEWDAPLLGEAPAPSPIPGPEVLNLRAASSSTAPSAASPTVATEPETAKMPGSNHFALAGAHTAHGGALFANDMHLGLRMPNIWYRASLAWTDTNGVARQVTGVTLPGTPLIAAGSNGNIAWGFTNSYGDWTDLIELDLDPANPRRYQTPQGWQEMTTAVETIAVKGGKPVELKVDETIWGPVLGPDHQGRVRVVSWVAHHPEAVDLGLAKLESAETVDQAIHIAENAGVPAQNFTVGAKDGRIAWTILGALPKRRGWDGATPTSWADGTRGWNGWLAENERPTVVDPPSGRLWTANNRTLSGEMLATIGNGGYDLGARAQQIRDDLAKLEKATPKDLLAIQVDDRAVFLERWHKLLLGTLDAKALEGHADRAELKRLLETTWTGRASVESVAYRVTRMFRLVTVDQVASAILAPAKSADKNFSVFAIQQLEGPIWQILTERPIHLLDPKFATWNDQLLAVVDLMLAESQRLGGPLANRTWGERNTVRIQHPLSLAVPRLDRYLDIRPKPLPGDNDMPRVQGTGFGASERMVIAPGREGESYFHMPGGQSGHPLSPYYRAGHEAWENGEPTPFLPGPAKHHLTLAPGGGK